MMFAVIRPDSISVALFVHVIGAMILVGALVTAAAAAILGWRDEYAGLRRFSSRTLLVVAFPAWIVMRVGAEWTYSKEHLDAAPDQAWVGIGFITADLGGVLLLLALILGGIGVRRARKGGGGALLKASGVIATVILALYVVAVWAMGGKPT